MGKIHRGMTYSVLVLTALYVLGLCPLHAEAFSSRSDEVERVEDAIEVFRDMVDIPEEGLPEALLKKASAIAIVPGVIKAAYGIGGQYGKGILLVKDKGNWSDPCFIRLAGGSIGWQIGVQKTDVVLVFKSRKSIDDIEDGKITLGADVSVTAGPVGRRAEASTDLDLEAEIYSYSKSKGLFAGVSIKGASISIDHEANEGFYDRRRVDPEDIFFSRRLDAPPVAGELRRVLERYVDK